MDDSEARYQETLQELLVLVLADQDKHPGTPLKRQASIDDRYMLIASTDEQGEASVVIHDSTSGKDITLDPDQPRPKGFSAGRLVPMMENLRDGLDTISRARAAVYNQQQITQSRDKPL